MGIDIIDLGQEVLWRIIERASIFRCYKSLNGYDYLFVWGDLEDIEYSSAYHGGVGFKTSM